MGHAYSLIDVGEITLDDDDTVNKSDSASGRTIKLVRLRNPWGKGEWEGSWSDRSDEREKYDTKIASVFNVQASEVVGVDFQDGTFYMRFSDWRERFTSLFVAVNFPDDWEGRMATGTWSGDVGGNRIMGTWISNPKFRLRVEQTTANDSDAKQEERREVFVGLYITDSRLSLGYDYYKVVVHV